VFVSRVEMTAVGFFGGIVYVALELLWRGRTHWSMLIVGGLGFLFLYLISAVGCLPLWKKWILGVIVITTLELLAGMLLNLRLGWAVWDYSEEPFNLGGQICALYILFWSILWIPANFLCVAFRRFFQRIRNSYSR